jgi:hypothetical protein
MINTQNASNLNITLSNAGANFNALDNDWFIAQITNNFRVQVYDATNVPVRVILHGWKAMSVLGESLLIDTNVNAGYGFISTTLENGVPKTIINPAVSLFNTEIGEGTLVYMRLRAAHDKYNAIYECITMANSSTGLVKSVQCVNNILVVTYI